MKNRRVLLILLILIMGIFIVNMIAIQYYLYWRIFWFDIPMHFLGGFWLGLGALWLYFLSGRFKDVPYKHRTPAYVVTLAVVAALVFGGLWEVYELGIDVFIRLSDTYDVQDTTGDIIMDILGALVSAWYFIKGKYYSI